MHNGCHKQNVGLAMYSRYAPCTWQSIAFLILFVLSSLTLAKGRRKGTDACCRPLRRSGKVLCG